MTKGNGKTEGRFLENEDLERELPAAEEGEEAASAPRAETNRKADGDGTVPETEKLKAEREALIDRLARLQAEFDNARKRAVREQQDFREFAAAEVIKSFLPVLDSFELALKVAGGANSNSSDFRNGIDL